MTHMKPRCASKRDQIVRAARKLFLKSGYGTTSMDALAAEAGVSKRTLYSHFENKEALFGAIMVDLCNETGCTYPKTLAVDVPPEQVLQEFALTMVGLEQTPEDRDIFRVVLAEGIQFPELGKVFWDNGPEPARKMLAAYLAEQVKRGVFTVEDPDTAAAQFIGMVKWPHSMPELFGVDDAPNDAQRQRALTQAIAIFLKGISVKT